MEFLQGKDTRKKNLDQKMRKMMIRLLSPLIFSLFVVIAVFCYYGFRYGEISGNLDKASRFNLDFKESIDLKMYHYSVGSREQTELPISDVQDAIALATSLKDTTVRKESQQEIRNVIDYCGNLERRMYQMAETKDYDTRQQQLENNVYVLTNLIQEKMMNYLYYETGYMVDLQTTLQHNIKIMVVFIVLIAFIESNVSILASFQLTKSITRPIHKLCENIGRVGKGQFEILSVETYDAELEELDYGIMKMAGRMDQLLRSVKEEEHLRHKTQMQLLQEQINPHFLYNTLDTIVWLVEAGKQAEAVKMLTDLSLFFRTALSKGKDIISLKEEMLHTKSYLEIQQMRYADIMDYEIHLPKELEEYTIPKLTLQPLTENALYHGVKEKRGKSRIEITCQEEGENIHITVRDTGRGMTSEQLGKVREALATGKRIGFGLAAVQERVRLHSGEEYGMSISSTEEEGTTVHMVISKKNQLLE